MEGKLTSGLVSLLSKGVGVIVATVSPDRKPAITRGWGPRLDESTGRLEACITAQPGSETLSNLETTGEIAVTVSRPTTYETMQMKGTVDRIQAPTEDDLERAKTHLGSFLGELELLGLERKVAANVFLGDFVAVRFVITDLFDQTPREGAGARLL